MEFTAEEKALIIQTLSQRKQWLEKKLTDAPNAASEEMNRQLGRVLAKFTAEEHKVETGPQSRKDVRILLVDDDEPSAKMLATQLEGLDFDNTTLAHDGQSAIKLLYDTPLPFHLVLCDWNMPIKNGLEVHEAMEASERYVHTPFVMSTSVTQATLIREAIDRGINDYLAKPISEQALKRKLKRFFPQLF
ncbi:response regulator [Gilvimarinus xylanilyticus]|uniref:Response regulator n=1 Tax=Gilvimarinus xylanilyticus TaxID=2944139 RepID=A0A9X2HUF3_9GAMM|nr:response regulator [Gilvimarinus xylanilyticus]MCP8898435.1 response regulator [Gilvimarinus xylanilyticus]